MRDPIFELVAEELEEGVVMKRGNAPYPVQLRSDTEECRAVIKHRFVN
jgi:hypothetical protein